MFGPGLDGCCGGRLHGGEHQGQGYNDDREEDVFHWFGAGIAAYLIQFEKWPTRVVGIPVPIVHVRAQPGISDSGDGVVGGSDMSSVHESWSHFLSRTGKGRDSVEASASGEAEVQRVHRSAEFGMRSAEWDLTTDGR